MYDLIIMGLQVLADCASKLSLSPAPGSRRGLAPEEIRITIFPHLTVAEILREAIFAIEG